MLIRSTFANTERGRAARAFAAALWLSTALVFTTGCSGPKGTRIDLTTFDERGAASQHYTDFSRASFRRFSDGRIEVVMKAHQPSSIDPTQAITQYVYVQTFWLPQPGKTYADSSQINARTQYAIMTPPTGVRYDGGAFVTYSIDRRTGEAVGHIESGDLLPKYRMGNAVEPFGPAKLTGTFRATENPGDVVRVLKLLKSQFTEQIADN